MNALQAIAIVGPTGVGKSALAMALAEAFGGEIVSADSRQVYRHLDIGTAKPTADERVRVPHHLLDVVDPDETFDAARYRAIAIEAVRLIRGRGRPVLICGGTGLYVRALLHGLFPGPVASPTLRRELENLEISCGPGTLHRRLAAVDPAAATRLHPHDMLRVVRALEVAELTGRPISAWQRDHRFGDRSVRALIIGCVRAHGELLTRIETRCRAMIAAGLLEEIRGLWARGYAPDLAALQSVGYREMGSHLRGECDFDTAFDDFVRATRRLAKRQMTWFRGEAETMWFHPDRDRATVVARTAAWIEQQCPSATSISNGPSLG